MKYEARKYKDLEIRLIWIGKDILWFTNIGKKFIGSNVRFSNESIAEPDIEEHFNIMFKFAVKEIDELQNEKEN